MTARELFEAIGSMDDDLVLAADEEPLRRRRSCGRYCTGRFPWQPACAWWWALCCGRDSRVHRAVPLPKPP